MKAVYCTKYGGPEMLYLTEVPVPVPGENEVLIKIHAATVTAGDCEIRRFDIPILFWAFLRFSLGLRKPNRPLGQELAGEIEAVGKRVTQFKKGDKMYASTQLKLGAYAQYTCLPEKFPIHLLPSGMTYEEAATLPTGGLNGLHFIKMADVQPGESVLINGAGGSIGTYALQIAKSMGAVLTCVDTVEKEAMLRSLGADEFIDYKIQNFTKNGKLYDVVIDVVGKVSFTAMINSLQPGGRCILGNPSPADIFKAAIRSKKLNKKVTTEFAKYTRENLSELNVLSETGKIKPYIDRTYALEDIVNAHRYVDSGLKKGNVTIRVSHVKHAKI